MFWSLVGMYLFYCLDLCFGYVAETTSRLLGWVFVCLLCVSILFSV